MVLLIIIKYLVTSAGTASLNNLQYTRQYFCLSTAMAFIKKKPKHLNEGSKQQALLTTVSYLDQLAIKNS
jgi:hypothetical protein